MNEHEMRAVVSEIRELSRMADELASRLEGLKGKIKAQMQAQGVEEISGTDFKATWKEVTSSRLDSKALKAAAPELYERFTKQTTSRRFTLV